MMRKAASSLRAFRSLRLVLTISITCLRVTLPTFSLFGSFDPAAMLAAFFNRTAAGGLFVVKDNDLFFKNVITTRKMSPAFFLVAGVKFFDKPLIFFPPVSIAVLPRRPGVSCPGG